MFDLYGTDRLTAWKQFRNKLETSSTPFDDVAEFWSWAPFVSSYLNPESPQDWPDPWHLVLDNKFDDLGIALGMLYTVKLTNRFTESVSEIHAAQCGEVTRYVCVINNHHVLNYDFKKSNNINDLTVQTKVIWRKT